MQVSQNQFTCRTLLGSLLSLSSDPRMKLRSDPKSAIQLNLSIARNIYSCVQANIIQRDTAVFKLT